MRNGGSGRTSVAPAEASNAATRAGAGASANKDGMRSLARRDTQANNMARGTARAAKSNAPATVITDSPQILASGSDLPQRRSLYQGDRSAAAPRGAAEQSPAAPRIAPAP